MGSPATALHNRGPAAAVCHTIPRHCEVGVVVTSAPHGKRRDKGTRMALQCLVSSTPLQDLPRYDGEFPFCEKSVPEDAWQ